LESLWNTSEISHRIAGVPAEIRTENLPDTSFILQFRYVSLLGEEGHEEDTYSCRVMVREPIFYGNRKQVLKARICVLGGHFDEGRSSVQKPGGESAP
jgi:hypothetical protein